MDKVVDKLGRESALAEKTNDHKFQFDYYLGISLAAHLIMLLFLNFTHNHEPLFCSVLFLHTFYHII